MYTNVVITQDPPSTYLKTKKFKGPKMDFTFSLHVHFHFTSLHFHFHKHGGRRSIAGIKESFKGNAARARLARAFPNKKISREISCKKFKTHLQFYVKISNKNLSSFFWSKLRKVKFKGISFKSWYLQNFLWSPLSTSYPRACESESEVKWKWSESEIHFWSFKFFRFQICWGGGLG